MAHYFGFVPSDKLKALISEAEQVVASNENVEYYPYRDALTHQTARDLTDNLLVGLVEIIPNPERQASMRKIVGTIERATDTLLNILLGKENNKDVLPSFHFLRDHATFIDNEGIKRVGFKLSEKDANTITEGFAAITPEHVDRAKFKTALETMNEETLTHFISRYAETLKLGMIKRKSVPVAKSAIDKGMSMALNKLLPDLPNDSLNRLANYYRPFIIEKPE
ncbi:MULTISPECIES: hypothetical protein [Psychrobacter]|uniref:hypothetical protein n=1 Tax=Psychrobacter TaxID=497 RepID=UPI00086D204A|nr:MULTISPECIES: hypothetical protein [Psychrobacter]MBA6244827.1 hypothetical protein [Psychrobacter sp. Urea-trap-18]MBA6285325.1 hypothetical protein [Psychrobacter sp. Urea-trap-16]MBA6318107.1 hypothetical protein [Psychrobacter sp. Urea-trap-20]MBA6333606.1 hypothetical protein [Psychrobacter sp. Urea-trap-19]OEH68762.1 MAG: hypothetical protein BAX61_00680 [Psychrobacter sp. B29-1]|tara:strand:+ start:1844 stop:2512 length:669 start_codon:yes stop_codon:yes gene_type:complete